MEPGKFGGETPGLDIVSVAGGAKGKPFPRDNWTLDETLIALIAISYNFST
jgi:hypothetical protein